MHNIIDRISFNSFIFRCANAFLPGYNHDILSRGLEIREWSVTREIESVPSHPAPRVTPTRRLYTSWRPPLGHAIDAQRRDASWTLDPPPRSTLYPTPFRALLIALKVHLCIDLLPRIIERKKNASWLWEAHFVHFSHGMMRNFLEKCEI